MRFTPQNYEFPVAGQFFYFLLLTIFYSGCSAPSSPETILVPVIDGEWWSITGNPDLGEYSTDRQQPVDFGVWQAADGTWQLWSCIRHTACGGHTRLFYGWEGKSITDTDWTPQGIKMEADTTTGELEGGMQAPYVFWENGIWHMLYGGWARIFRAESTDGKNFDRVLDEEGKGILFEGPYINSRDPMVIKIGDTYYCYYCGHLPAEDSTDRPKAAIFCRTSKDLDQWGEAVEVSSGGKVADMDNWHGGDAECPFVVPVGGSYILFRNQRYGTNALNTQYSSPDPLDFGVGTDQYLVNQLEIAAPEIVEVDGQYYIFSLKPGLDGIQVAKLKFEPVK